MRIQLLLMSARRSARMGVEMKKAAETVVILCMIALLLCVFPVSLVRKNKNIDPAMNGSIVVTDFQVWDLKQTFVAQTDFLEEIAFDVVLLEWGGANASTEENLLIRLRDEKTQKILVEKRMSIQDIQDGAYTYVQIKKWVRKGRLYSISVMAEGPEGFAAVYITEDAEASLGSPILCFEGEPVEGQAMIRYVYGFPLNIKNVLCLWAFILTVGLSVLEILTNRKLLADKAIVRKFNELLNKFQIPILLLEFGIILFLVIRICRNQAVDWDEAYTWKMVTKNNIPNMLKATAADVHPPLYYLIVKAAMSIFGETIFVAKMASVAGMAATSLIGITLIRKHWGAKAAILFLLVAGLGTQMIYFNVNVRMYSWMSFFVLAAGLTAYEIMLSGKVKWWICFTVASLGGIYTQYFAVVPLAFLYLFLLIWFAIRDRRQIKKWVVCCLATVVGYLPWLTIVVNTLVRDTASTVDERVEFDLAALCEWAFKSNIKFTEYMPAVLFVLSAVVLWLERKKYGNTEKIFIAFSGLLFLLSYVACMLIASQIHHFWHNRYMVDVLLFVWLFIIIVISRRGTVVWGTAVVWLGISVLSSYTIMQAQEMNTVPWTQHAEQVLAQVQDEKKVVYNYSTFDTFYGYWLPNAEFVWYENIDLNELGNEFYMIAWGSGDFPREMYEDGTLKKEVMGQMRFEEGVAGVELWKMSVKNTK